MKKILFLFVLATMFKCQEKPSEKIAETKQKEFVWEGANIYFLLTDRFNNGDTSNDINFDRTKDLDYVIKKVEERFLEIQN